MKKSIFYLLLLALPANFIACGDDDDDTPTEGTPSGQVVELEAIDLGLSVKWANMNVGAIAPWDYGSYFAWGEIDEKTAYTKDNYDVPQVTRISGTEYDAALAKNGEPWRMPTESEMKELISKCSHKSTTMNGVSGTLFTSDNGNSIFLPSAGWKAVNVDQAGSQGGYWAGTGNGSCGLLLSGSFVDLYTRWEASVGMSVRAVQ